MKPTKKEGKYFVSLNNFLLLQHNPAETDKQR
jgi:hypothetical protein